MRWMLLIMLGMSAALLVLFQLWAFPLGNYISAPLAHEESSGFLMFRNSTSFRDSEWLSASATRTSDLGEEAKNENKDMLDKLDKSDISTALDNNHNFAPGSAMENIHPLDTSTNSLSNPKNVSGVLDAHSKASILTNASIMGRSQQVMELKPEIKNIGMLKVGKSFLNNDSIMLEKYVTRIRGRTTTLFEMDSFLHNSIHPSGSLRPRQYSKCDHELQSAKSQIRHAPVSKNISELYALVFRNVSMFERSYDLMERILKVYVYKEGEKPIFHQPKLGGLYASEGWFMKLIEKSRHFLVKDPRKAHLFYLPFSSEMLRTTLYEEKSPRMKKLEKYLIHYVNLIKNRYQFWNRTGGADHFFVACHDWAPRITLPHMSNCMRVLCNSNIARGFSIGKDVSLLVTYIRSGNDPFRDLGGKPPSERLILAFFAGSMHGYLRPILLQYWENKFRDMKIFGPMQRDIEGKAVFREFMKSSKYCICAREYGVHTHRVVESIFYECVPVIISDNYVPPFFEVLNWKAFSVFILEKDIPNLRNILLSIPEDRYLEMQLKVKMVQRHFLWHKIPEKYDLFHMILHSIIRN
ncbi:hypothetical protein Ancab_009985 [Ancistrocladus abbreviatus]